MRKQLINKSFRILLKKRKKIISENVLDNRINNNLKNELKDSFENYKAFKYKFINEIKNIKEINIK